MSDFTLKDAFEDFDIDIRCLTFQMIREETSVEVLEEAADRLSAKVFQIEAQLEFRTGDEGNDLWLVRACSALGAAKSFGAACRRRLVKLGVCDDERVLRERLESVVKRIQTTHFTHQFFAVCQQNLEPGHFMYLKSLATSALMKVRGEHDAFFNIQVGNEFKERA